MKNNFDLDEEYEEIDYVPKHKTFPVELKIVKREKYKPFFDFEEEFEELYLGGIKLCQNKIIVLKILLNFVLINLEQIKPLSV